MSFTTRPSWQSVAAELSRAVQDCAGSRIVSFRVIAQAGRWRRNSTLPPHPGLPAHRAWQRARADALEPLLADVLALVEQPG